MVGSSRCRLTKSRDNEDKLNRWGESGASGGDSKYCLGSLSFCMLWGSFGLDAVFGADVPEK